MVSEEVNTSGFRCSAAGGPLAAKTASLIEKVTSLVRRAGHRARRFLAGTVAGPTVVLCYRDDEFHKRCQRVRPPKTEVRGQKTEGQGLRDSEIEKFRNQRIEIAACETFGVQSLLI